MYLIKFSGSGGEVISPRSNGRNKSETISGATCGGCVIKGRARLQKRQENKAWKDRRVNVEESCQFYFLQRNRTLLIHVVLRNMLSVVSRD